MASLRAYAAVAVAAALTTFVLVPVARRIAVRVGAVVAPDERHVHTTPTPTAGGMAMFAGVLVGVATALAVGGLHEVVAARTELVGVVVAVTLVHAVGLVDDLREISPPAKLAGLVLAGSVLVFSGVSILVFRVPFFDLLFLSADWSYLLTVVWVVVIANAVNLIDGLDGLAAGIVAIASATFFLYALRLADEGIVDPANPAGLWAVIAFAVCVGFLPHNVHPARVFMGDSGALMLGTLLAASTMSVGGRVTEPFSGQTWFFFAPIFIPLVILGVPLVDLVFAVIRRAARRQGLSAPDKEHLHHRLMRLGHGHRRSVLILWGWTALLSVFVLYPTYTGSGDAVVPVGIGALALALFTVLHPRLRLPEVVVDEATLDRIEASLRRRRGAARR